VNLDKYKYYSCNEFTLFNGDSRNVIAEMPENSIDSIVCDPPYELGFMGKSWDSTGIANDVQLWKEVLRVLKPGGHLLAFSGSRTYHRMAVAIEDAGFEIRDQIMWVYGSGFPKSHNISKGIDKAAGAEREVVSSYKGVTKGDGGRYNWHNTDEVGSTMVDVTIPATDAAKQWQGWGTALKPAHEPIVLARKPVEGTVANNVLTYGVGGINIDGTRVGSETVSVHHAPKGTFAGGEPDRGSDTSTYENHIGRFPANFIHDGSDQVVALFPDVKGATSRTPTKPTNATSYVLGGDSNTPIYDDGLNTSAARFFYCAKASKRDRNEGLDGFETKVAGGMQGRTDGSMGSITYNKNHHPTVKPIDLMQYLCRLITPPNGTILDPFLGSGSTGKAAMYEGFNFVGIELTQEYLPIAKARIEFALNNKNK
jgi:site-specific DNA-methyltransferase (adenine-specific)